MSREQAFKEIDEAAAACTGCGICARRCEVLHDASTKLHDAPDGFCDAPAESCDAPAGLCDAPAESCDAPAESCDAPAESCDAPAGAAVPGDPQPSGGLSLGALARAFAQLDRSSSEAFAEAVRRLAAASPELVFAIRRCCICGYCTEACPEGIPARKVFAALREALSTAGVTGEEGFETTQVDKEWHIFSVYRAVHGIAYADLPHVQQASEQGIDTLFFPGCPLLSYAPELTREVFAWLEGHGFKAAITEDCCGSPLKTAGFGDRYRAHKQRLAEAIAQAGIRRVIGVCPACLQELASAEGFPATVELLGLPQVLQQAGVTISTSALEGSPAAVFDSCADRSGAFGKPLRALFEPDVLREMGHAGSNARCCGAGGATVLVDPAIGARRAQAAIDEARATAPVLVSNCPTCAYTFAYHAKGLEAGFAPCSGQVGADALPSLRHCHYLELIFKNRFDWDKVFEQLEGMWTGEYGAWVNWVFSGQEGRE